jgi:hypothetical protein
MRLKDDRDDSYEDDEKGYVNILRLKDDRTNEEKIKNCKYVHIGGNGNCRKCGGVHKVLNLKGE